jgi:outer membrane protein OmpA-like peptidoglycan-associated protein
MYFLWQHQIIKVLLGCIIGLIGWQSTVAQPLSAHSKQLFDFKIGIQILLKDLSTQMKDYHHKLKINKPQTLIGLKPFVKYSTAEMVKLSDKESGRTLRQIAESFSATQNNLSIAFLSADIWAQKPDFIMDGAIALVENHKKINYQIDGFLIDPYHEKVVARKSVNILGTSLVMQSWKIERDSLVFDADEIRLYQAMKTVKIEEASPKKFDHLMVSLIDVAVAYEANDYKKAYSLFRKPIWEYPKAQQKIYLWMQYIKIIEKYQKKQNNILLGKAYGILAEKILKERKLKPRVLFKSNYSKFVQKDKFKPLLCSIGKKARKFHKCLHIIGHASSQGQEAAKKKLSINRAASISNMMHTECGIKEAYLFLEGKSDDDCLECIGSEDERDQIDRRVELFITDCPET